MSARVLRALFIRKILDARFSLSTLLEWLHNDPEWWNSPRNAMGRGLYGQAMRERQRLEGATDGELLAELADLGALGPPPRLGDTPA
jgi:hypothetical protein